MVELIFRGTFETSNLNGFMDGLEQLFKDSNTKFNGQVLQFDVTDYTDYEEIINEEITNQIDKENDCSNNNEPPQNQGN